MLASAPMKLPDCLKSQLALLYGRIFFTNLSFIQIIQMPKKTWNFFSGRKEKKKHTLISGDEHNQRPIESFLKLVK